MLIKFLCALSLFLSSITFCKFASGKNKKEKKKTHTNENANYLLCVHSSLILFETAVSTDTNVDHLIKNWHRQYNNVVVLKNKEREKEKERESVQTHSQSMCLR